MAAAGGQGGTAAAWCGAVACRSAVMLGSLRLLWVAPPGLMPPSVTSRAPPRSVIVRSERDPIEVWKLLAHAPTHGAGAPAAQAPAAAAAAPGGAAGVAAAAAAAAGAAAEQRRSQDAAARAGAAAAAAVDREVAEALQQAEAASPPPPPFARMPSVGPSPDAGMLWEMAPPMGLSPAMPFMTGHPLHTGGHGGMGIPPPPSAAPPLAGAAGAAGAAPGMAGPPRGGEGAPPPLPPPPGSSGHKSPRLSPMLLAQVRWVCRRRWAARLACLLLSHPAAAAAAAAVAAAAKRCTRARARPAGPPLTFPPALPAGLPWRPAAPGRLRRLGRLRARGRPRPAAARRPVQGREGPCRRRRRPRLGAAPVTRHFPPRCVGREPPPALLCDPLALLCDPLAFSARTHVMRPACL